MMRKYVYATTAQSQHILAPSLTSAYCGPNLVRLYSSTAQAAAWPPFFFPKKSCPLERQLKGPAALAVFAGGSYTGGARTALGAAGGICNFVLMTK